MIVEDFTWIFNTYDMSLSLKFRHVADERTFVLKMTELEMRKEQIGEAIDLAEKKIPVEFRLFNLNEDYILLWDRSAFVIDRLEMGVAARFSSKLKTKMLRFLSACQ